MKRLNDWLKMIVWRWLGLERLRVDITHLFDLNKDLVSIGVDVHFKTPHMILIYSRLQGGQIREISADFESMQDLSNFVQELKFRFNTGKVVTDVPRGFDRGIL